MHGILRALGVYSTTTAKEKPAAIDWMTGKKLTYDDKDVQNADGLNNLNHPKATDWTVNQALEAISWLAGTNVGSA